MNDIFHKIFRYIPKDNIIPLFGLEYFIVLFIIIATVICACLFLKNRNVKLKENIIRYTAFIIIFLYIFDFFVQPFWSGSMITNKLPFHICTATGILISFVTFSKKFNFMKTTVTVWAILAPLMFIIFPIGNLNAQFQIYSYPILQSYTYHILEFFWGMFMVIGGFTKLEWRKIWQPIVGLFPMALWATIGQELYFPNEIGENYLFLRTDISGVAPQWMFIPALFIAAVLSISIIFGIYNIISKYKNSEVEVK